MLTRFNVLWIIWLTLLRPVLIVFKARTAISEVAGSFNILSALVRACSSRVFKCSKILRTMTSPLSRITSMAEPTIFCNCAVLLAISTLNSSARLLFSSFSRAARTLSEATDPFGDEDKAVSVLLTKGISKPKEVRWFKEEFWFWLIIKWMALPTPLTSSNKLIFTLSG
uniref:Uncharacterized protein n=1 Tax=Tetranychus urticae TaxID=32264 RepID=T1L2L2_TETUR